jgi:hypothetical protein
MNGRMVATSAPTMICPQCREEFVAGITRCPDCEVTLISGEALRELERRELAAHPAPVTVFRTSEPDLLPVLTSLLEGSDIPYVIAGEELLGLFPTSGLGLVIGPRSRAAEIQVPAERATEARELLETVHNPGDDET